MGMKNYILLLMASVLCTGCATMDPTSRTIVGSQVGMLAGTVTGAVIGHSVGGYRGEAIGSFVGSVGGTVVGAAAASSQNQRNNNRVRNDNRSYDGPYVVIEDIYLEDRNGNQMIDAGETCRISFILRNESRQPAYSIEPIIKTESGTKYLKLSKPAIIREIRPHGRVSYTITVHAEPKLKSGEASFSIRLKDSDGYLTEKETFQVPTRANYR
ncbi:glycine zipper family protein [Parabacteroides sp.]|uniref:glycine zipper family protein n=1 Tax=Parabacteroides sp. TaxID=1869337 RepID=UPI00308068D2